MTTTNKSHSSSYKRILLKLSGEGLMGNKPYGLDEPTVMRVAEEIKSIHDQNVEICIVIGGGNIFRGVSGATAGMDRSTADYMGMLATLINALALQDSLERKGLETRVLSAIPAPAVCEQYIRRRALRHLEKGRIIIFGGGIGNPFFTTDTTAALRAAEMNCDVILKATQVDGVFDADPKKNDKAQLYQSLSYHDVLKDKLKVMDATAISLAQESDIPIIVFNLHQEGSLKNVLAQQGTFTIIKS